VNPAQAVIVMKQEPIQSRNTFSGEEGTNNQGGTWKITTGAFEVKRTPANQVSNPSLIVKKGWGPPGLLLNPTKKEGGAGKGKREKKLEPNFGRVQNMKVGKTKWCQFPL